MDTVQVEIHTRMSWATRSEDLQSGTNHQPNVTITTNTLGLILKFEGTRPEHAG